MDGMKGIRCKKVSADNGLGEKSKSGNAGEPVN